MIKNISISWRDPSTGKIKKLATVSGADIKFKLNDGVSQPLPIRTKEHANQPLTYQK